MGVQIPLGYGQWLLPFRLAGDQQEMVVTCGFLDDSSLAPNVVADAITNPLFATSSFAASTWATVYSFGPARVTCQRSLGPVPGVGSVTRVGTNAAFSPTQQNTAVLCRKFTGRGGRQGRGRFYLPAGLTAEANITSIGVLLETVRAQLQTDLEAWRVAVEATTLALELLHSEPEIGPPLPPDAILQFTVDTVVATQRTRMRR